MILIIFPITSKVIFKIKKFTLMVLRNALSDNVFLHKLEIS